MRRVLAVDQSYKSCGIVVFEDEDMVFYERYVTDVESDMYDRANQLALHLQLIAAKRMPDVIALEGLAFGSKGNATRDLGGLLYTIVVLLRRDGWKPIILPPTAVKKAATGKGKANKNDIINALPEDVRAKFDELGVKKTTGLSDLADAYFIGKAAMSQ